MSRRESVEDSMTPENTIRAAFLAALILLALVGLAMSEDTYGAVS